MSKVKNITLNGKKIGDYSKNELARIVVQAIDSSNKYQQTAVMLFKANKILRKQSEFFKRKLR